MTHSWDSLSPREAEFTQTAMDEVRRIAWAEALIARIEQGGGLTKATKSLLFELRFGHALHQAAITPDYEIAGEAESTLDFGFYANGYRWRVELMRLEETDAVKKATQVSVDESGIEWAEMRLSSNSEDVRQSPEGETLKAVARICQKCEKNGRPHKFPLPRDGINVLLVDSRAFLNGGDSADCLHVALGVDAVPDGYKMRWNGKPIGGVFWGENSLKGVEEARARIHLLGFVREKEYGTGSFAANIKLVANPNLFGSDEEAAVIIAAWPLQPVKVLNVRTV